MTDALDRATNLPLWSGPVNPEPLAGGMTNMNFTVVDGGEKYVVRIGADIPEHHVMRFNENAASIAAFQAGLSPEVVYKEKGILVIRFIEGRTFDAADVRDDTMLVDILDLIKRCHQDIPKHLAGPALIFWVFHVIRDYANQLQTTNTPYASRLGEFAEAATLLERALGPTEIVYGHNDLLAGNFIHDGTRLWLIDWDYAGFNSPLFDLANLSGNNDLSEDQERWMLTTYFGEHDNHAARWQAYRAMKCASLLRESMWGMISDLHSALDLGFADYTAENLAKFDIAYAAFSESKHQ